MWICCFFRMCSWFFMGRFVELELDQGETERSLSIIVAYVERRAPVDRSASQDVRPMQILKARKAFEEMVGQADERTRLIAIQVCGYG
jgi:hypothetical protein